MEKMKHHYTFCCDVLADADDVEKLMPFFCPKPIKESSVWSLESIRHIVPMTRLIQHRQPEQLKTRFQSEISESAKSNLCQFYRTLKDCFHGILMLSLDEKLREDAGQCLQGGRLVMFLNMPNVSDIMNI